MLSSSEESSSLLSSNITVCADIGVWDGKGVNSTLLALELDFCWTELCCGGFRADRILWVLDTGAAVTLCRAKGSSL